MCEVCCDCRIKIKSESRVNINEWYVLYTRANSEKRVGRLLCEAGFKTYVPISKELRVWNDRKRWIEAPLFRSYVFIYTDYKSKHKALNIQGVIKYVTIGSQQAKLREEEIGRIIQLCKNESKIIIEYDRLAVGQKVLICDGPLIGLEGHFIEKNGDKRIRIHIEGLNCFASVQIEGTKIKSL